MRPVEEAASVAAETPEPWDIHQGQQQAWRPTTQAVCIAGGRVESGPAEALWRPEDHD